MSTRGPRLVCLADLSVDWEFIETKWLEWGEPSETIDEFLERPVVLHRGFEFLISRQGAQ